MKEQSKPQIDDLLANSSPIEQASPRPVAIFALVVVGYAFVFACFAASIAFFQPEDRAAWSGVYIAVLYPFGDLAFGASQTVGGFLGLVSGVQLANLGAAVPLFVAGLVSGFLQALVLGTLVLVVMRFLRRTRH